MNCYGKLSTAFYDLDKPAAPPDAVAYYLSRALQSNGPVLEPMCGSGRFLLPLLQAGVAIEGVDISREMLTACRRRAKVLGLIPTLHEQSVDSLSLPRQYGFAFAPSGSLGLIQPKEGFRACLRALRRHLTSGATLLVELVDQVAFAADPSPAGSRHVAVEGDRRIHYEWHMTRDPSSDAVHWSGKYRLLEADSLLAEESEEIVLQMYSSEAVLHELQHAGFAGAHVVQPTERMSWLKESGCTLYACKVAGTMADAQRFQRAGDR